jgi:predicted metal-binding protein
VKTTHALTGKPEEVRRIAPHLDPERLKKDLQALQIMARDAGADDCNIIPAGDVVFNPEIKTRVAGDNAFASIHWPLDYPKDDLEEAIRAFAWGIFFRTKPDFEMPSYGGGPIPDLHHRRQYQKIYEIVTRIESAAFYMGYHLAAGLAAGNCRSIFCADEKRCQAAVKGRACIRPNIGRPSMAAAGMDASAMAIKLNWQTGAEANRFELAGLVMVA